MKEKDDVIDELRNIQLENKHDVILGMINH
jgi:hypothetical protein